MATWSVCVALVAGITRVLITIVFDHDFSDGAIWIFPEGDGVVVVDEGIDIRASIFIGVLVMVFVWLVGHDHDPRAGKDVVSLEVIITTDSRSYSLEIMTGGYFASVEIQLVLHEGCLSIFLDKVFFLVMFRSCFLRFKGNLFLELDWVMFLSDCLEGSFFFCKRGSMVHHVCPANESSEQGTPFEVFQSGSQPA